MHTLYVTAPNERPDYRLLIVFLWDDKKDVDSDGNSMNPADRNWTELTLAPRDSPHERVDIDEFIHAPLVLKVQSENREVALRAAYIIACQTEGKIAFTEKGPFVDPELYVVEINKTFHLNDATTRFNRSPFLKTTIENPYPDLR